MSENSRFYPEKMDERKAHQEISEGLGRQLDEIFSLIQHCEKMWALEERIEKQL
jgi:hypothetical protein